MTNLSKMKHSCLLLTILSLFSMAGMAQNKIAYTYDDAGNRTSRKVVILAPLSQETKSAGAPAPVEEELGEQKITVYPNPTKGELAVEVTGGDTKDEIRMVLYNVQGSQLQNKGCVAGKTRIDMSAYPTGLYILRIITGNKTVEFKIIKE